MVLAKDASEHTAGKKDRSGAKASGDNRLFPIVRGSAGGHNGIKNIIAHLGTQEFPRVRIGVGEKPARMDLADYVLGRFPKEEAETMTTAFKDGAAAVVDMMTEGVEAAMNHFNGAARGEKEKLEKQKAERKEEVKTQ